MLLDNKISQNPLIKMLICKAYEQLEQNTKHWVLKYTKCKLRIGHLERPSTGELAGSSEHQNDVTVLRMRDSKDADPCH